MQDVSVIIAAGGASMRLGTQKQFLKLADVPVIIRSIQAFDRLERVREIIVAARKEDIEVVTALTSEYNISKPIIIVSGGETRQQSVYNALLKTSNTYLVAVHDGARPLVDPNDIIRTIEVAEQTGGATLGVKVKDTVKQVDGKMNVTATLDRDSLYSVQTPQIFKRNLYFQAIEAAIQNGEDFTDDCQLMERMGFPVVIVSGSYSNIKLTTADDLVVIERILEDADRTRI